MGRNNKQVFRLAAFICLALSNGLIFATNSDHNSITRKLTAFLLLVVGLLSWDISRLGPGNNRSFKSVLIHYLFMRITATAIAPICHVIFQKLRSDKFRKLQDEYLLLCLRKNGNTALGKDLGLGSIASRKEFVKQCPLTKYPVYEPYVKRIEDNGEKEVIINYPVDVIMWTSGTTGKNKKFPCNTRQRSNLVAQMTMQHAIQQQVIQTRDLKRQIFGTVFPVPKVNKTGILMGSLVAVFFTKMKNLISHVTTSPRAVYDVTTEVECCYLHLLFGILSRDDVSSFNLLLGPQAYQFFRLLEIYWRQLCNDIESGTVWKDLKISQKTRTELEGFLKPNPELAAAIRVECERGFKDIIPRIWPHCKCVVTITTGAFSIYRTLLQEKYTGTVPLISHMHSGTEGNYGLNLTPLKLPPEFVMEPDSCFVEFIHESVLEEEQPETVLPEQAVIGENYEFVVTNHYSGLWRYRTGDVVKLKGFWNSLPTYEFNYRHGQLLNVFWEKTPESLFYAALDNAVKQWNVCLHDYTTTEHVYWLDKEVPGTCIEEEKCNRFYVVFLDITHVDGSAVVLSAKQKLLLDDSLKEVHEVYKTLRENGNIQPMKVFQVRFGSFSDLRQRMLSTNDMTSSAQFKMPRVIRNTLYLNFLKNNITPAGN